MSNKNESEQIDENLDHERIEQRPDPQARIFVLLAGVLMVAALAFGLLNTFNVIHM